MSTPEEALGEATPELPARRAWLQRAPVLATAAGAALVVIVALAAVCVHNYNTAETWQGRAQDAREELADADARITELETKVEKLDAENTMRKDREANVAIAEAGLAEREAAVKAREDAITATEQQIAANTIAEGTWTVGVDVQPGTYRTESPVTGTCYWSITATGSNGDNILSNDIVTGGHPTVTINEGQDFTTQRCGSWIKQ